jgi:prepilin-type N-terminal cleavage/methylation domain-containing protein
MLNRLRNKVRDESGFSMPEVLVVAMIVGILIAINVGPGGGGCSGQGARSADTEAKAVARAAAATMEAYANNNLGAYEGATASTLHAMNPSLPTNVEVLAYAGCTGTPPGTTGSDACFSVRTAGSLTPTNNRFQLIKRADGKLESLCTEAGKGGCPTGGKWSAE